MITESIKKQSKPMYQERKNICIRLTPEEFDKLTYHCNAAYISKNQFVRNWIQSLPNPPKPKGKQRAKTQSN